MTSPSLPAGATRRWATVAGLAAAGVLSLCALPATAGAQNSAATQQVVDLAARGFGGKSALLGLSSFRLKARGETFIFDEAFRPGNTVIPASNPFTVSLDYDLRLHGDRIRADSVRTSVGTARRVREVISARRGYISGIDSNGGTAATTAMFSDRWAAVTREQLCAPEREPCLSAHCVGIRP